MVTRTNQPPTMAQQGQPDPPDIETMREAVDRLLDPEARPGVVSLTDADVDTLILQIRGHIQLLAPEVEQAATRLTPGTPERFAVLGCVWEARSRLEAEPRLSTGGVAGHARRLARTLNALCDHHEALEGLR